MALHSSSQQPPVDVGAVSASSSLNVKGVLKSKPQFRSVMLQKMQH